MLYEKKKSIIENDVVLVHVKEQPAFFARVEKIVKDVKPGWWQVSFLLLQIPLTTFTWILDNEQIRGADFTMNGTPIRLEKVVAPSQVQESENDAEQEATSGKEDDSSGDGARILSFNSKKKD
ncbi:hypothetical protein GF337_02605 [candidate division KSB1 bacterium]|nr:hypothetical protein [candidate division KSB1 bacterium]